MRRWLRLLSLLGVFSLLIACLALPGSGSAPTQPPDQDELEATAQPPTKRAKLVATADPKLLAALSARVKLLANCKAADYRAAQDAPLNLP